MYNKFAALYMGLVFRHEITLFVKFKSLKMNHVFKTIRLRRTYCAALSRVPTYKIREAVRSDVPIILKYITVRMYL